MKILYIGKFQPFHLGHKAAFNILSELSGDIIIALGSPKNDKWFTLEERITMIKENTGLTPQFIEDIDDPEDPHYWDWGTYVLDQLGGNIDIIATGNPQVRDDFYNIGKHVLYFNRDYKEISGTVVRSLIRKKDNSWKDKVPSITKNIILDSNYYKMRYNND